MTSSHSPWPLFGNDLDQARSWIRPQLKGVVPMRTGHLAISIGLGAELMEAIQTGLLVAQTDAINQWRFRLARLYRERNPYVHLFSNKLHEQSLKILNKIKRSKGSLGVELNGGIGDHLEALSLIIPWTKSLDIQLDVVMEGERQNQIGPLLTGCKEISLAGKNEIKMTPIPIMVLRAAIMESESKPCYKAWIPTSRGQKKKHYLCCWRAEGIGDKYSAHSRSVPWELAYDFYERILKKRRISTILDITNWTQWERNRLQDLGIITVDPRKGSLLDLIDQCQMSHVYTIDTALAHLCAAAGLEANLLLSLFPDERWHELHRPENNYGRQLKLWRSSQFGSWSALISSLNT